MLASEEYLLHKFRVALIELETALDALQHDNLERRVFPDPTELDTFLNLLEGAFEVVDLELTTSEDDSL